MERFLMGSKDPRIFRADRVTGGGIDTRVEENLQIDLVVTDVFPLPLTYVAGKWDELKSRNVRQ